MAFGDFARLDGYDPEGGFKDTFKERFGAAPLDPFEAAALRQRQFRNRPSETSQETIDKLAGVASDVLIPKTPLDVAATIALGPVGRVPARIGALALGGLLQSDEAQAGPVSKAIGAVLAPLRGKVGGPWEGGIRAYHSSPHDFDKVDFSKLRTGEGANVYGAGHYMAENPAVSGQGGQYWQQFSNRFSKPEKSAADFLATAGFDREAAIKDVRLQMADPRMHHSPESLKRAQGILDLLESGQPVGPRTYEMNLRARPEELLDWDKPMTRQTPYVTERMQQIISDQYGRGVGRDYIAGGNDFKDILHNFDDLSPVDLSNRMAGAGIPGIRYLDEGSRISSPDQIKAIRENIAHREALLADRPGDLTNTKWLNEYRDMLKRAENPTYNYVGTDPSRLDVLAKYGLAGAGATGFGTLAAQDTYQQ